MNNSNGNGSANGQHNSSFSPSTIDIEQLENRPELPRAEPRNTGTLAAPGPGGSGHVASLPTFTRVEAAGVPVITYPAAANGPSPADVVVPEEPMLPTQTAPLTIGDVATDPDVDPVLAAREGRHGLEEFVRDMNNLGPLALPPDAAIAPPFAAPPFGVGVLASAVTVDATAQGTTVAATVAATAPAVNSGVAAPPAPASSTAPTAQPAPIAADPGPAVAPRRRSHGGAAFDEHGELRVRPDGPLYLEHTPPSTLSSNASPSPPPPAATDPTAPPAASSPRPLAARSSPGIAASPPRPPAVSITPRTPTPAASTGNTPEPNDPGLAEFFDFGAASE